MASPGLKELKKAAMVGDVEFLKKCIQSKKPVKDYITFYPWDDDVYHHGNIFHIAARDNREEFIREVIGILPIENTRQLLLQPCEVIDKDEYASCNPLHEAARKGNVKIVKMFLSVFESTNLPVEQRPWLQRNRELHLPCHLVIFGNEECALVGGHEECALELFKIDTVQANMITRRGTSLLYEALVKKFVKLALEIVKSSHSISCAGLAGVTSLHVIHFINHSEEAEKIFRQLVLREQKQIKQLTNDEGNSIFHSWSTYGKLWPFKCFLNSNDIISDVKKVFRKLTMQKNNNGDNPFHVLGEHIDASDDNPTIEIAKLLRDTFKEVSHSISDDQLPWLVMNNKGHTPLSLAMDRHREKLAMHILSIEKNAIIKCQEDVMFLAIEKGCHKVTQMILEDPSMYSIASLGWIEACEKGHVSALGAFIEHNPGAFRDHCIKHKDSPLHHIRLQNVIEYEQFLKIPRMKDLLNVQDSRGETPLHKAIRRKNLYLTETLLNMDKIIYDISDSKNVTAMDLLALECKKQEAWRQMCKRYGIDPNLKTTYFKHKTNLLDVRSSLFVVAALLATITFTAAFTLPGGFNQDTGDALLAKNASFLVFLVSDTLALFFSMLVLMCLTWSMVFEPSKSLIMIDRSMMLLIVALNCTLLTFVTGVYSVIAPKSMWVAILIIAIISSLIVISFSKRFLYEVMNKLFHASNKECRDLMLSLELGYNSTDEHDDGLKVQAKARNQSGGKKLQLIRKWMSKIIGA